MVPGKSEKIEDFSTCGILKHFQETSQKSETMEIHIQPLVRTKNKFMLNERMWQIVIVKHFARDPLVSFHHLSFSLFRWSPHVPNFFINRIKRFIAVKLWLKFDKFKCIHGWNININAQYKLNIVIISYNNLEKPSPCTGL